MVGHKVPCHVPRNMTTAKDVMTVDIETVSPDEEISSVLTKLSRRSFSGFPVVDEDDRVVGIVTLSDLVDIFQPSDRVFWIPVGLPPFTDVIDYPVDFSWEDLDVNVDLASHVGDPISSIMVEDVVTVELDADLDEMIDLLADEDRDINRLPVVDSGGHLVGIVARQDLLGAIRDQRLE